jgi:uncharacterized repeat protein (TIGR03843 family)
MTAAFAGRAEAETLRLLRESALEPLGRLAEASNQTWLARIRGGPEEARCVYKPVSGERPLWDFPTGTLADREVAAYAVSTELGWGIVPPTVWRDGPFGEGMCQWWVDTDPQADVLDLAQSTDHAGLRRMALFDAVINNSDRKAGHLLPARDGHLYGCDHGVSFAEQYKLRTVLWQWRGRPIADGDLADLRRLRCALSASDSPLHRELSPRLTEPERYALRRRVEILAGHGAYPYPSPDWPAVPWPPV